MLGKIFIKDLHIQARVGHLVHERHATQNILINIAVWTDVSKSIVSTDLADTVDYVVIQKEVIRLAAENEYVLIETFANDILSACLADTRVEKAWVRLEKPHKFPESDAVGIELERAR
jgi:FolB domain-containing protein